MSEELCQNDSVRLASQRLPRVAVVLHQLGHYLQSEGLPSTLRRVWAQVTDDGRPLVGIQAIPQTPALAALPSLALQPGELVEVKSEEEIRKTLDVRGKHRGLDFTDEMLEYCGRQFRVFKRVERICMEGRGGEMRTLKDTVSLEGVICNGGSRGCDRACLLFWREAWLKRVDGNRLPS